MIPPTSGDLAEKHGNAIADSCLRGLQDSIDQVDRGNFLNTALLERQLVLHPKCVAGDFFGTMVNVIEPSPCASI